MQSLEDLYDTSAESSGLLDRVHPRRVGKGVASLVGSEEMDPEPQAFTRSSSDIYSAAVDVDRPDGDTELYWQEYEKNPIIAKQIQDLASDVFEAGWWLTAESDETIEEVTEFLENIGIKAGQTHQSFSQLGQQAVIQHQARGTFMGEKMTDDQGRHTGINPVNPSTFKIYTKPGVNVLVPPDHDSDADTTVKHTDEGDVAAYVQFDDRLSRWNDRTERHFTRDEMVHWARRPDLGDVRGNSVIEPVYERSIALREKLQDNDLAIAMKAWPLIMFQTGTPEHPWTLEEQEDFMADYSEEELGPGMFQAVPGDVEVNEFAGETADIEEHVQTDVNLIVAGMPGPITQLGSFVAEGAEVASEAQERSYRKLVRSTRRDLESVFTPYLREVAESWDLDPEDLEIHIGRPGDEVAPEDVQGSIIRYQSNAGDDEESPRSEPVDDSVNVGDDNDNSDGGEAGNDGISVNAELTDPRLVGTSDLEDELGATIEAVLETARDETLAELDRASDPEGVDVENAFDRHVHRASAEYGLVDAIEDAVVDTFERTTDTLGQRTHAPRIKAVPEASHRELLRDVVQSTRRDVVDVASDIGATFRHQLDRADDASAASERIRDRWDAGTLLGRSDLIARMRTQEVVNRIKLDYYRQHDAVVGISITSRCSPDTHDLTAELAGCDGSEPAVARFDADRSLGAQFQAQASADPPTGFDPLPPAPPFHFGDTAELVPVTDN